MRAGFPTQHGVDCDAPWSPDLGVPSDRGEVRIGAGNVEEQAYRISTLRPADGLIVAQASGEIDVAGSSAFREQLLALLAEEPVRIVVDLSSVAYVDTYALSALVDLEQCCRLRDCRLAIVCSEGRMRRALAATGLDELVPTHATVDEALSSGEPES